MKRVLAGNCFMKRNLAETGNSITGNQEQVLEQLYNGEKGFFKSFARET